MWPHWIQEVDPVAVAEEGLDVVMGEEDEPILSVADVELVPVAEVAIKAEAEAEAQSL